MKVTAFQEIPYPLMLCVIICYYVYLPCFFKDNYTLSSSLFFWLLILSPGLFSFVIGLFFRLLFWLRHVLRLRLGLWPLLRLSLLLSPVHGLGLLPVLRLRLLLWPVHG